MSAQTTSNENFPAAITSVVALHGFDQNESDPVGLSGLAWDADENLLHAVSDLGVLYHFQIALSGDQISSVSLINRYSLLDSTGEPFKGKYDDAEGLETLNAHNGIEGDTRLLIAFERKPRVSIFDSRGQWLEDVPLGSNLDSPDAWRKPNSSLESVTYHPEYGVLVGLEKPAKKIPDDEPETHSIHAAGSNRTWRYQAGAIGKSALTAISFLENNQLLLLEREFRGVDDSESRGTYYAALTRINLDDCETEVCQGELLGIFQGEDLHTMGNFEGLAILDQNHYLMASDNGSHSEYPALLALIVLSDTSPPN